AQLKENVDKLEKAIKENRLYTQDQMAEAQRQQQEYEERAKKVEAADNAARAKNPQTRARAAADLAALAGPSAVPTLIFLMQSDPNYDVRIAAANALGSLGPAARQALPNIDGVLRQPPYEPPINATAEQLDAQMKDGDYRRALRDAKARIGK
ncbi:MAG TPA: HEAT repeat domain-containing protein, partial [Vicinamibacteria bacterium]|nr:HEAT repeat domain-containing protein [Vicinamibacteria bacterium]